MANFVNPTGTSNATAGDDTILFNALPAGFVTAIDALAGNDSLTVQVPFGLGVDFTATDNGGGSFTATAQFGSDSIIVSNVENVEFDGTRAARRGRRRLRW